MSIIQEQLYAVLDGNAPALKTYINFKRVETELKEALEAIKDQAMQEAEKYGKSFVEDGVHIEIRSAAGKWDYKHIPEWKELDRKMDELQKQLQFAYKAKATLVKEDTGEILPMGKYIPGKETIFVTLKK